MAQQEFLIGFAQLALVLTGFMSVFVVFSVSEQQRSRVMTHHAASMLVGSVITVIAAIVPIVFAYYGFEGEAVWWWSSLVFAFFSVAFAATMLSMTVQLTAAQFREAGVLHMVSSYCLGTGAFVCCALNLLGVANPGHYALALLLNFMVPLIAFIAVTIQKVFHW